MFEEAEKPLDPLNTRDLAEARAMLDQNGGWLLDLGEGHYLVTEDDGIVLDLRGSEFVAECKRQQIWDETDPNFVCPANAGQD